MGDTISSNTTMVFRAAYATAPICSRFVRTAARGLPIGRSEECARPGADVFESGSCRRGFRGNDRTPRKALRSPTRAGFAPSWDTGIEAISRLPINGAIFWHSLESIFLARMPALISAVEAATGKSFEETGLLSPFTMSFALRARREAPDAVEKARRQFDLFARDMQTILMNHDVLLSPVQPMVQPAIDVYDPNGSFEREAESIRAFMTFTALANVIGAPAMSVPLYWTDEGLPLGAHFMTRPGQDRMLLELAFELEAARPWQDRWPPHSIQALVGGIP